MTSSVVVQHAQDSAILQMASPSRYCGRALTATAAKEVVVLLLLLLLLLQDLAVRYEHELAIRRPLLQKPRLV